DGLSASITTDGRLEITSDSPDIKFAFADDTSGTLAALGLNTFFTGTGSQDIGVNADLRRDPGKLAISSGGIGEDTKNGEKLANLLTAPLVTHDGNSLSGIYEQLTSSVATGSQSASAVADGFRSFQQTLESQHLAISGVNIDE